MVSCGTVVYYCGEYCVMPFVDFIGNLLQCGIVQRSGGNVSNCYFCKVVPICLLKVGSWWAWDLDWRSRYGHDDREMITSCERSLFDVGAVVCSVVAEYYVRCCCCAVCVECREVGSINAEEFCFGLMIGVAGPLCCCVCSQV